MSSQLQTDNLDAFRALRACLDHDRPLALVGSGLVIRAGYPSWNGLVEKLHVRSRIQARIGLDRAEFIRQLDDPLFQADLYRKELSRDDPAERRYHKFLEQIFRPQGHPVDPTLRSFVGLGFSHFLTTNYDPTIQLCGETKCEVIEWRKDAERRNTFITSLGAGIRKGELPYVVHLHGIWSDPKSVVLTDGDYLDRYVRNEEARRLLFAIFATKRVVFVGFGLQDPDLMQLLRTVASSLNVKGGRHFVLLSHDPSKEDAGLVRDRLDQKFNIVPVFYPATKNHALLEKLIRALAEQDEGQVPDFTKQIPEARRVPMENAVAPPAPPATPSAAAKPRRRPIIHPDDPQKDRWGGKSERNGRKLTATVDWDSEDWYEINLVVRAMPGSADLSSPVTFHVHDTFPEMEVPADEQTARQARLTKYAYGAFTVGVEIEEEPRTELELDLAQLKRAPRAFRDA